MIDRVVALARRVRRVVLKVANRRLGLVVRDIKDAMVDPELVRGGKPPVIVDTEVELGPSRRSGRRVRPAPDKTVARAEDPMLVVVRTDGDHEAAREVGNSIRSACCFVGSRYVAAGRVSWPRHWSRGERDALAEAHWDRTRHSVEPGNPERDENEVWRRSCENTPARNQLLPWSVSARCSPGVIRKSCCQIGGWKERSTILQDGSSRVGSASQWTKRITTSRKLGSSAGTALAGSSAKKEKEAHDSGRLRAGLREASGRGAGSLVARGSRGEHERRREHWLRSRVGRAQPSRGGGCGFGGPSASSLKEEADKEEADVACTPSSLRACISELRADPGNRGDGRTCSPAASFNSLFPASASLHRPRRVQP